MLNGIIANQLQSQLAISSYSLHNHSIEEVSLAEGKGGVRQFLVGKGGQQHITGGRWSRPYPKVKEIEQTSLQRTV